MRWLCKAGCWLLGHVWDIPWEAWEQIAEDNGPVNPGKYIRCSRCGRRGSEP